MNRFVWRQTPLIHPDHLLVAQLKHLLYLQLAAPYSSHI
jgi:hypothetical protein